MKLHMYFQGAPAGTTDLDDDSLLTAVAKALIAQTAKTHTKQLPMPIANKNMICTINIWYEYQPSKDNDKLN